MILRGIALYGMDDVELICGSMVALSWSVEVHVRMERLVCCREPCINLFFLFCFCRRT